MQITGGVRARRTREGKMTQNTSGEVSRRKERTSFFEI